MFRSLALALLLCAPMRAAAMSAEGTGPAKERGLHGISIVFADERSEKELGGKVSRKVWADTIERIEKGKPESVILKLFLDAGDKADDAALAQAAAKHRNVFTQAAGMAEGVGAEGSPLSRSRVDSPKEASFEDYASVRLPYPALASASAGIGMVHVKLDKNGAVDRWQVLTSVKGRVYASLPLLAYARMKGLPLSAFKLTKTADGWNLAAGKQTLRLDHEAAIPIDFPQSDEAYPSFSLAEVYHGKVSPSVFQSRIVILGCDLPKNADNGLKTPKAESYNKVELFSDALSTLLRHFR